MRMPLTAALAAGALAAAPAFAEEHEVRETIAIAAPAADVWQQVRNFSDLEEWLPGLASCEIEIGEDNGVGAVRLIGLPDGGQVREELLAHDDQARSMSYSMLEAVRPVRNYRSTLTVEEAGAGSEVVWHGRFESEPDQVPFFEGLYRAGLANLKSIIEGR